MLNSAPVIVSASECCSPPKKGVIFASEKHVQSREAYKEERRLFFGRNEYHVSHAMKHSVSREFLKTNAIPRTVIISLIALALVVLVLIVCCVTGCSVADLIPEVESPRNQHPR